MSLFIYLFEYLYMYLYVYILFIRYVLNSTEKQKRNSKIKLCLFIVKYYIITEQLFQIKTLTILKLKRLILL